MKTLFFMACMVCVSYVYAGTTDPQIPDKKYVEYGSNFKSVVGIEVTVKDKKTDKDSTNLGSAVVINENWIITAAHVVENYKSARIIIDNAQKIELDKIIIHKDFFEKKFGAADIAMGYTKSKIEIESYPELYKDRDELTKEVSISGYGFTARMADSIKEFKFDKQKRAGTNNIDHIYDNLLICTLSKQDKTDLEFLICSGDSGGGLFIDSKLAGINSCVLTEDGNPDSGYGDESGHTRISTFYPWIMEHIKNESRK